MQAAPAPYVRTRLSVMMFLQYAIWGAWLPILYPFLMGHRGFTLDQTGLCLMAGAVGALAGPFIAGQLADRSFATEKLLAISHFIGAILVYFLAGAAKFEVFLTLSFVYGLVYAPTMALTNSISLPTCPTATATSARSASGARSAGSRQASASARSCCARTTTRQPP